MIHVANHDKGRLSLTIRLPFRPQLRDIQAFALDLWGSRFRDLELLGLFRQLGVGGSVLFGF